jgi:hypothetical protein
MADIRGITREIQQETRHWDDAAEEATDNIGNSFSSMLKKITAGFSLAKVAKALLDFGKDAVQAASDLEEVQNVVDVTFGQEGAAKIETWAKKAGSQFGLTETQAKRFTSTLGAMMKSSGMAGDEIVDMSTNLAGLAADMASFYNLDFDTAFQKIRSGISGETEPLKQLGINMSVANLEAFALQQGLEKTFSQMSQGEQTMLRYQYLMQATSDAQGDFARTSSGYANSVRKIETNVSSLKESLGKPLLDVVAEATGFINNLIDKFSGTKERTILDEIADIDIKKEAKLAEIQLIRDTVTELTAEMGKAGKTTGKSLADSLNALGDDKVDAWKTLLSTLSEHSEDIAGMTGQSSEGVQEWLKGLADAANDLDPANADAWKTLFGELEKGLNPQDTETKGFLAKLAEEYLALGTDSEEAVFGLKALGLSTEEIEEKQATWLAICKELTKTIPGLSSIIDSNTGEVKGGIPAIQEYADEWKRAAEYQAQVDALRAKKAAYENMSDPTGLKAESRVAYGVALAHIQNRGNDVEYTKSYVQYQLNYLDEMIKRMVEHGMRKGDIQDLLGGKDFFGHDVNKNNIFWDSYKDLYSQDWFSEAMGVNFSDLEWFMNLEGDAEESMLAYAAAVSEYYETLHDLPIVQESIEEGIEDLTEEYGQTEEEVLALISAQEEAERSMSTLEKAANGDADAMEGVKNAVNAANDALKEMADYAASVHEQIASAIDNVAKSLDRVDYMSYGKQIEKISELTQKQGQYEVGSDEWKQLQNEIEKANESLVTTASIMSNLDTQATFLDDYLANLKKARDLGLSDELLATLSDGSVESAEYLSALVEDADAAKEIDKKFQEIQSKKAALADELTGQQLSVDETYKSLAEKAQEAITALDLGEEAKDNAASTIQGIADGIGEKEGEVAAAVDGILAQLERLNGYGIDIDFGGFGNITFTTSTGKTEGSGRMGIPLVPHDDYIARLHEGERVLTAQENQIWNALRNGGVAGFDLETLGGVMRDNVKAGGDVYLNGRVVGAVISDQQGKSYRQLQRSGWQA